jgi:hypothetical protein
MPRRRKRGKSEGKAREKRGKSDRFQEGRMVLPEVRHFFIIAQVEVRFQEGFQEDAHWWEYRARADKGTTRPGAHIRRCLQCD